MHVQVQGRREKHCLADLPLYPDGLILVFDVL
jgi:hypothetical protein